MKKYNSEADTRKHMKRVQDLLSEAATELLKRGMEHDLSKLGPEEKPLFDKLTPILKDLKYGSPEYQDSLDQLKPSLDHHYKMNTHHPQHYENGIDGFDLFDLIEMFFDWKAATERSADGDISKSIRFNKDRFGMSEQLVNVYMNTARRLGYVK